MKKNKLNIFASGFFAILLSVSSASNVQAEEALKVGDET